MRRLVSLLAFTLIASTAAAQFSGFQNHGLVGVGRIPASSFDLNGPQSDTLGGIFSSFVIVPDRPLPWKNRGVHRATLVALPDRGFGDGAQNYRPRLERFRIRVVPSSSASAQNQITFELVDTMILRDSAGTVFTGFDPDSAFGDFPKAATSSLGEGHASLDAEGVAIGRDGSMYISDEYGPFVYRFDAQGRLQSTLRPPDAFLPRKGSAFGSRTTDFSANDPRPDSGRNDNRGLEGLSITPDGKRLVAALQSPLLQDSGSGGTQRNASINSRILVWDIEAGSPNVNKVIGDYVFQISTTPTEGTRHTPVSEILALSSHQFLVLERDSYGRGQIEAPRDTIKPALKAIVLVDTNGATNLAGTPYELERGAPNQTSLPFDKVPDGVVAVTRQNFINLIDETQLAKFGLNVKAHNESDNNSISEKWEGLALLPLNDASAPNDYLLLVGNDNDFKAATVRHNDVVVGTNEVTVDNMLLAWRVTLPIQ